MPGKLKVSHLYAKNWQLVLFSYFIPIMLFVPFLIVAGRGTEGNIFLVLLSLASLVCATAFFLGSSQREFMSRSFTFLLPHFRLGMIRQHFTAAGLLAFLAVILVLALPGFQDMGNSSLSLALSTGAILFALYELTVLVVFFFSYSTWLPFNAIWVIFLITRFWGHTSRETLGAILDHPLIWMGLAAAVGWWMVDRLGRPGLHRRCAEEPYISLVHLKNQAKIEEFKHARNRHKNILEGEGRPAAGLIRRTRNLAAGFRRAGRMSRAMVAEAMTVSFLTSFPRNRAWAAFQLLFIPMVILGVGYYEGWQTARGEASGLPGWFSCFAFMFLYWTVQSFHHVKTRPLGLLGGRRDRFRAGWLIAIANLLLMVAGSLGVWGLFMLGQHFLPPVDRFGPLVAFTMPPAHLVVLSFFYLPAQLLVGTLWRMQGSAMVIQQTGTFAFFLFHAMLLWGNGPVRMLALGLALGLWVGFAVAWRWRVYRSDLG